MALNAKVFETLQSQKIGISEGKHLEVKFRGVQNFKSPPGLGGARIKNGRTHNHIKLSNFDWAWRA